MNVFSVPNKNSTYLTYPDPVQRQIGKGLLLIIHEAEETELMERL